MNCKWKSRTLFKIVCVHLLLFLLRINPYVAQQANCVWLSRPFCFEELRKSKMAQRGTGSDGASKKTSRLRVAVRLRPYMSKHDEKGEGPCVRGLDSQNLEIINWRNATETVKYQWVWRHDAPLPPTSNGFSHQTLTVVSLSFQLRRFPRRAHDAARGFPLFSENDFTTHTEWTKRQCVCVWPHRSWCVQASCLKAMFLCPLVKDLMNQWAHFNGPLKITA